MNVQKQKKHRNTLTNAVFKPWSTWVNDFKHQTQQEHDMPVDDQTNTFSILSIDKRVRFRPDLTCAIRIENTERHRPTSFCHRRSGIVLGVICLPFDVYTCTRRRQLGV